MCGIPAIDDTDNLYISEEISSEYSLDPTIPIHQMSDTLQDLLYDIGYIDELKTKYPSKNYLNYLGSRKIDVTVSRPALNFALIRVPSEGEIDESLIAQFKIIYSQCREYFTSAIYVYEYSTFIDYYDNFIALCIMVMTLQQMISRMNKNIIEREFFDDYCINLLFDMYSIPYMESLDSSVKRSICQNLNMLIKHKSTDKVLYDVASLLGFDDIDIYKYLLVKQQNYDENELPINRTKTVMDEDGREIEVPDYEQNYSIYFQRLELKDRDNYNAMQVQTNKTDYSDVVTNDPYWWDDDDLKNMLYESEFNYVESKYLSLTLSFKLTEIMFECIYFINMLIEKKNEISTITLQLTKISEKKVPLFDSIILLCVLFNKKNHLKGEILISPSKILHVLGFNFDRNVINSTIEYIKSNPKIDDQMIKYIENTSCYSADAINKIYTNIVELRDFISYKLSTSHDIEEYHAYETVYRSLYIVTEQKKIFNMGTADDPVYPDTYEEYLQWLNPELYNFASNLPIENCSTYIDHILSRLNNVVSGLKHLYHLNDSSGESYDALVKLITFFKSYTTDLIGMNIVYVFDTKPLNLLKLIDHVIYLKKEDHMTGECIVTDKDTFNKIIAILHCDDELKLKEKIEETAIINWADWVVLFEMIDHIRVVTKIDNTLSTYDYVENIHKQIKVNDALTDVTHLTDVVKILRNDENQS